MPLRDIGNSFSKKGHSLAVKEEEGLEDANPLRVNSSSQTSSQITELQSQLVKTQNQLRGLQRDFESYKTDTALMQRHHEDDVVKYE
ncbi:hypothetical protein AAF712_013157 [Marasmius tenuissimus]|uniref:Uncharacterized protein n=1 Tax=Marasmius tenuissimus TaxID=585030 RepID=A0ABR2ZFB9_9AGAR